jgi:phosphatidylglycerophosphate synthase
LTAKTLVIGFVRPSEEGGAGPGVELLGLQLLRRQLLAADRARFERVIVLVDGDLSALEPMAAGTGAILVAPGAALPPLPAGRLVLLSPHVIPQVKWLRELRETHLEPERFHVDPPSVAVLETTDPGRALASLVAACPGRDLVEAVRARGSVVQRSCGGPGRFTLTDATAVGRAEKWLLHSLVKETEGFMSQHVERRISLAISRRLAATSVTPNAMTLVSVGVGLVGALFFLEERPVTQLVGALLFLLHSILDGCDGELARLRFQESRWGGILDFWGDNVVHAAVFSCIAIGWSRAVAAPWPLALGAAAVGGTLLSAGFVYVTTMRAPSEGPLFTSVVAGPRSRLSRMADALAQRDFIYLVVLLSAFGKAQWFLVLAAAGAPVFFAVLLALFLMSRREETAGGDLEGNAR